jgi:hypothetical protein
MGQSPLGIELGTWIAIWYRPAKPGASAAPYTIAGMLSIVTVGRVVVEYVVALGTAAPGGATGEVGPNPVPQRMITSPGFAATVVVPGKVPF